VDRITTSTLDAVSNVGQGERGIASAGVRITEREVAEDPRHGRLMFSVAQDRHPRSGAALTETVRAGDSHQSPCDAVGAIE
jgi:hypothetical protein